MSPRGTRTQRTRRAPRTVWLAAGVVVIGATGVTAVAVTGGSEGAGPADDSRPARAHTLALDGKDQKKRALPRTETQSFSLVGVSWKDSTDNFEGTAQIRTRGSDDGAWTDWHDLDFGIRAPESAEGKDSKVRGASEPLWVGPSDAIEARVVADGQETAVPDALRLDLIDPGKLHKAKGTGDWSGGGQGEPTTTAPSPSVTESETAPGTATPSPTESSAAPTETPVTEQPPSPTAPPTSEAPPEPTADPSEPTPSDDPTVEPTAPTADPDPSESTPAATEDPQETQEPTAEPSTSAPSEDPTGEPSTDPSGDPTSQPTPTASTTPGPDPTTDPVAPKIVSRAGWGADESLVADPPSYLDKVDAVFVHHTAGTNSYSCADSPAIVRGILTYHVKTNGWNDIGYNFFVDKCGTVFEGRAGGVDKPVRGAHTYGFNGYSSGISVLGDYENGGTPTAAAKRAVAEVAAWKLAQYGVDPETKVTLTAAGDTGVWDTGDRATLNTISGHRDGFATLCPGATLYSALPEIRRTAGASVYATG